METQFQNRSAFSWIDIPKKFWPTYCQPKNGKPWKRFWFGVWRRVLWLSRFVLIMHLLLVKNLVVPSLFVCDGLIPMSTVIYSLECYHQKQKLKKEDEPFLLIFYVKPLLFYFAWLPILFDISWLQSSPFTYVYQLTYRHKNNWLYFSEDLGETSLAKWSSLDLLIEEEMDTSPVTVIDKNGTTFEIKKSKIMYNCLHFRW